MSSAPASVTNPATGRQLVRMDKLNPAVKKIIDVEAWASAIVNRTEYVEPDPEFLMRMLALQTISAESIEEAFRLQKIEKCQESIPNTPGASTGPFELTDLYVAASDFTEGNPCYVIMTCMDLELGTITKRTTGATNIQATLIALLANGAWPIRAKIIRGDQKDKGGRYMLFMVQPD